MTGANLLEQERARMCLVRVVDDGDDEGNEERDN